jgi:hypothetical protein
MKERVHGHDWRLTLRLPVRLPVDLLAEALGL